MSTALADYIAAVLASPDVQRARSDARSATRARAKRLRKPDPDDGRRLVQRPSTHFNVRGTWEAHEVEPVLAPPRSSLNPAFILGDEDL